MRARLSTNADEIYRRMLARQQAVKRELTAAAREIAPALRRENRKILQEKIYSVEIPFNAKATARDRKRYAGTSRQTARGEEIRQWRRTGELLRREQAKAEGAVVILFNPVSYAGARYRLGTEEGRKIRTPGVQSVQWHREALDKRRTWIREVRRRHVLRALRLR